MSQAGGAASAGMAGGSGFGGAVTGVAGSGGVLIGGGAGSASAGVAGSDGHGAAGSGGTGPGGGAGGSGGAVDTGGAGGAGAGGTAGTAGAAGTAGGGGTSGAAAFNPCPAASAPCSVMPLGDSITDGVGSSAGGGYRVELFHAAAQAHKALTFVGSASDPNGPDMVDGKKFPRDHEGHPGYTIDDSASTSGISPLVDQAIATKHPQIILLMIGTNDLDRNIDVSNAPARLGALLDRILTDAPNALLVVAKIVPTMDDGANTGVQTYNDAIAGLVQTRAANGKHIAMVDMFAGITAQATYKTTLMNDYLHPNDAGYVIMGDVWYAAIQSYLPAAP